MVREHPSSSRIVLVLESRLRSSTFATSRKNGGGPPSPECEGHETVAQERFESNAYAPKVSLPITSGCFPVVSVDDYGDDYD